MQGDDCVLQELWRGTMAVCIYFLIAASTMLTIRRLTRIPDELFRKALHFVLLASYIPFVFAFETWWLPVLLALALEILIYPALALAERLPSFSSFVNERKKGEFKHSLLLAFTMLAVCIAVCWGWLGDRHLILACMYAWGVGDAFAALFGKAFGKHKIRLRFADPHKSMEGSAAMFFSSASSILIVLLCRGHLPLAAYGVIPLAGAAAATLVELVTPNGMDTVTCPTAAMLIILPLTALFGGFA